MIRLTSIILLLSVGVIQISAQQYVNEVFEYTPAPGQFINKSPGLPANAQSIIGGVNGMVSLGFWGGYIVVGFEAPIQNHPDNPYGVDFTVFGNAFFGSSEPAIVMVMKDENNNGEPDDTWYELKGSSHFLKNTIRNYAITYTNPGGAFDVPWTDNQGESGVVAKNSYHNQPYYPASENFPHINPENYTLEGTRLPSRTFQGKTWVNYEFDYGYADNKKADRNQSHDVPDNPYTLDVLEGCGGDAFDISWAVDAEGNPKVLDEIDFVKIYTGVAVNAGSIGEVSPEIAGIATVSPNAAITGPTDAIVSNLPPLKATYPVENTFELPQGQSFEFEAYVVSMGRLNDNQTIHWESSNSSVGTINPSGVLTCHATGETEITATWQADNAVSRSYTITVTPATSTGNQPGIESVQLYPNPASTFIMVKGAGRASVVIYNAAGSKVTEVTDVREGSAVNIMHLPKGLYLVQIKTEKGIYTTKFLKQ